MENAKAVLVNSHQARFEAELIVKGDPDTDKVLEFETGSFKGGWVIVHICESCLVAVQLPEISLFAARKYPELIIIAEEAQR